MPHFIWREFIISCSDGMNESIAIFTVLQRSRVVFVIDEEYFICIVINVQDQQTTDILYGHASKIVIYNIDSTRNRNHFDSIKFFLFFFCLYLFLKSLFPSFIFFFSFFLFLLVSFFLFFFLSFTSFSFYCFC